MVEDNLDQKIQSKRKTHNPVAFGSKTLYPAQIKMFIYSKEFLAIFVAFLKFAHILWEATKPKIVLTDKKSVTRFFQTKEFPPALWDARDFVLHFSFKIAHCWFGQHCGWLSFQTRTQSHREVTSQIPGRHPNNTHWSDHIFLGGRWWRRIFLQTTRQWGCISRTNPWKKNNHNKKRGNG